MIGTASRDGVAVLTLEGALTQGEWRDAIDEALMLFPDRRAHGLILDYTRITWARAPSVACRGGMVTTMATAALQERVAPVTVGVASGS